jgi:hypothetical protein
VSRSRTTSKSNEVRQDLRVAVAYAAWRMCDLNLTTALDSGDASFFDRAAGMIHALPGLSDRSPKRTWRDVRPEDVSIDNVDGTQVAGSLTDPTEELPSI